MKTTDDGKLVIEIDLGSLWLGDEKESSIAGFIADTAARRLLDRADAHEVVGEFKDRVRGVLDEEIREKVRPLLDDVLSRVLQPTNAYGDPTGEPRTLSQIVVDTATRELASGGTTGGSLGRGASATILQRVIEEEVGRTLRKELQKAVLEAREKVLAAVREEGAAVLAETIARMARV